ncbi:MAG: DUF3307 domain-containing protein [Paracoccaceae bacterium]
MLALSAPALTTFCALLFAHVLADFVFQSTWMVANKRKMPVLFLHVAIVFVLTFIALGGNGLAAFAIALAHLVIDAIKTWGSPESLRGTLTAFLADQGAHLASLVCVAIWVPTAAAQGLWGDWIESALPAAILLSGFILAVRAGGFAVGLLMSRYQNSVEQDGLPAAGMIIGQLERLLIFLLVLTNQAAGIGFLIAAKSILRFDTASQGQKASEYVIIGTLASFAWALAIAYGTQALLEIATQSP